MKILRHQYYEKLPTLISAIKRADFIAFDFEFSGLHWNRKLINSIVDTYEFRYWKTRESVQRFVPLQIGLTPFYQSESGLKAQPFNINLFPLRQSLWFNTGSLQFLGSNGFDLNEWVEGGVPFIQEEQWSRMSEEHQKAVRQSRLDLMSSHVTENKEMMEGDELCFSQVIKLISSQKKPIIGHNCLFDLMFLLSGFVCDLPLSLADFKRKMHELFPVIFDTKTIVSNSLSLGSLVSQINNLQQIAQIVLKDEQFQQNPKVSLRKHYDAYSLDDSQIYHEAGFDSLMTGIVFARMVAFLQTDKKYKTQILRPTSGQMPKKDKRKELNYQIINQYRNKIQMGNIKCPLDLEDPEQQDNQSREHVYAITGVPFHLSSQEVEDALNKSLNLFVKIYRMYGNDIYFFSVPNPDDQGLMETHVEEGRVQLNENEEVRLVRYEKYIEEIKSELGAKEE